MTKNANIICFLVGVSFKINFIPKIEKTIVRKLSNDAISTQLVSIINIHKTNHHRQNIDDNILYL